MYIYIKTTILYIQYSDYAQGWKAMWSLLKWRVKKNNNISNKEQHQKAWRIASWTRRHGWSMRVLLLKCLKFFEMSQSGREKGTWSGCRLPREHHGWTRSMGATSFHVIRKHQNKQRLFSQMAAASLSKPSLFPELYLVISTFLMQTRVHLEINKRWQKSSFAAVIFKM